MTCAAIATVETSVPSHPLLYKGRGRPSSGFNHLLNTLTMSDAGRKDISDKIASAVKPDSQKGTAELAKDKVTDTVDNAVGDHSRSGDKSFLQQASDAVFGEKK